MCPAASAPVLYFPSPRLRATCRYWSPAGADLHEFVSRLRGHDFSYGMNRRRFHYCSVLDGQRAREVLGYTPQAPIAWPRGVDPVG